MQVALRAVKTLGKKVTLVTTAFVIAVSGLTAAAPFVLSSEAGAVAPNVAEVYTNADLVAAANDVTKNTISIKASFAVEQKTVFSGRSVYIDGNAHTLTFASNPSGWQGNYVLHAYQINFGIKNLKITGGDAAILANGSTVNLQGAVDVSGNEFGGIEVSQGNGVTRAAVLNAGASLVNSTEATGKPSAWIDRANVNPTAKTVNGSFTETTHIGTNQKQYYLVNSNAAVIAKNVTLGTTYAGLQEAIDAAGAGNTLELAQNSNTTTMLNLNKPLTIDGKGFTINAAYSFTANGVDNAVLTANPGAAGSTIKNLTVTNSATGARPHGIVAYQVQGAGLTLANVTATNGRAGLIVNGSKVIADGIHTSGNSWYGVDVDRAGAILTLKGTNTHTEAVQVLVDDTWTGAYVIDAFSKYEKAVNSRQVVYTLDATTPTIQSITYSTNRPLANSIVKGETLTVKATITDGTQAGLNFTNFTLRKNGVYQNQWSGGSSLTPTASINTNLYAEGVYSLEVYGRDYAGHTFTQTVSFTIDKTAPGVAVSAGALALPENTPTSPKVYVAGAAQTTFQASLTDEVAGVSGAYIELFKANYDGTYGNWVKDNTNGAGNVRYGSSPKLVFDTSTLNGRYGLKVVSSDASGNAKTTYHYFTIDSNAPTLTINTNDSTVNGSSSITGPYRYLSFKLNDVNGNLKEVVLNDGVYARGGTWNDLNWININASDLVQGENTVTVRDLAGNTSSRTFVYDTTAPSAPALSTSDWYVTNGDAKTLSWSAPSSDVAYYEYAEYNFNAPTSDTTTPSWVKTVTGTSTTDTAWQSDVTIFWRVRAVDTAGNVGAWSETRRIVSDYTDPTATLENVTVNGTSLSLNATGADALSGVRSIAVELFNSNGKIGDIAAATYGDNQPGKSLAVNGFNLDSILSANGSFEVRVTVTDGAGNVTTDSETIEVNVDRDVPVVTAPTVSTTDTTPLLTGDVIDADTNTAVVITIGDAVYVATNNGDGTWSYQVDEPLAVGQYAITVIARDSRSNTSAVATGLLTITLPVIVNPIDPADPDSDDEEVTGEDDGDTTPVAVTTQPNGGLPPATFGAAQILGVSTAIPTAQTEGDADVEGASTENNDIVAQAVNDINNSDGSVFGLAWYWWLLIVGAAAAILWGIVSAFRSRTAA